MTDLESIKKTARQRASQLKSTYAGALLPEEANALMQAGARLVDVRTKAELEWVGRVPGAVSIEWNTWPGGQPNPDFLQQLEAQVGKDAPVMFLCRSGGRSHSAATVAAQAGYAEAYNILQGFEGDKDAAGHRNTLGGWRLAGLPWVQG
ncbi:MAG: rhodanese-like domain-containing protein [Betaproteobacteria bacterium]|jgi:rhodanese-related sulfurtransferase|nr:rhodanese-like domain-containing protein [Betaproteobacteria bacterium]